MHCPEITSTPVQPPGRPLSHIRRATGGLRRNARGQDLPEGSPRPTKHNLPAGPAHRQPPPAPSFHAPCPPLAGAAAPTDYVRAHPAHEKSLHPGPASTVKKTAHKKTGGADPRAPGKEKRRSKLRRPVCLYERAYPYFSTLRSVTSKMRVLLGPITGGPFLP